MLIPSLYGETHLKSSTHIDKKKEHIHDTNKNQIIDKNVELSNNSNYKRIKMVEYGFYNFLIQMNLPFSDVESIYKILNKYSKSSMQYFKPEEGVICRLYGFNECSMDASAEALFQIVHDELLK